MVSLIAWSAAKHLPTRGEDGSYLYDEMPMIEPVKSRQITDPMTESGLIAASKFTLTQSFGGGFGRISLWAGKAKDWVRVRDGRRFHGEKTKPGWLSRKRETGVLGTLGLGCKGSTDHFPFQEFERVQILMGIFKATIVSKVFRSLVKSHEPSSRMKFATRNCPRHSLPLGDQESPGDGETSRKDFWWRYLFLSTCKQREFSLDKRPHSHFPKRAQFISAVLTSGAPVAFREHIKSQACKQSFGFPQLFDPH
ncbi:hypothetical protein PanWU01x14_351650 [Parasponia andersonii]|uniref:Uncharacterized protein n=1 Tax=Parasponia andersonii TaxID=3476 RepID=A0A2P5AAN3_PARAD|nr:hypothetical protein PanWU01x14_351650 [Parasponia andersonii]